MNVVCISIGLEITISSVAPDGSPTALSVVSVNLTAITISWDPVNCTQQNSIIENYTVTVYYSRNLLVSVSTDMTTVTIHNLNPTTEYKLRVQAVNENDMTSPSSELTVSTDIPTGT